MLDTRTKIVPAETAKDLLSGRPVVAAFFDPMVASHTQRLQEIAKEYGPVAVCVCDPPEPLLSAQARAELAAACRDVAIVVVGESFLEHAAVIIDERPGDLERRSALMRHVHSRQDG